MMYMSVDCIVKELEKKSLKGFIFHLRGLKWLKGFKDVPSSLFKMQENKEYFQNLMCTNTLALFSMHSYPWTLARRESVCIREAYGVNRTARSNI